MRHRRRHPFTGSRGERPRDPKPSDPFEHLVVVTGGLALYLAVLWFGIRIIGDTAGRSALIAALIVVIAGVGYWFCHQDGPGSR